MAKWAEIPALEQQISDLQDLVAKVTEVNAAQAEQLRKAQERIRAAEAERDRFLRHLTAGAETINEHKTRADRAWNEAIEAAAIAVEMAAEQHQEAARQIVLEENRRAAQLASYAGRCIDDAAHRVRSLAKEAGE
jgi:chromosome segregation ATPase